MKYRFKPKLYPARRAKPVVHRHTKQLKPRQLSGSVSNTAWTWLRRAPETSALPPGQLSQVGFLIPRSILPRNIYRIEKNNIPPPANGTNIPPTSAVSLKDKKPLCDPLIGAFEFHTASSTDPEKRWVGIFIRAEAFSGESSKKLTLSQWQKGFGL